jgi:hypothetical protein
MLVMRPMRRIRFNEVKLRYIDSKAFKGGL